MICTLVTIIAYVYGVETTSKDSSEAELPSGTCADRVALVLSMEPC